MRFSHTAGGTARLPGRLSAGLRERWFSLRNGLLASERFRRWAAAFPLTRPIAQHHARELFDLCAGFVYSQVLFACVRLKLLERLQQSAADARTLASELDLDLDSVTRLLDAARSLRLLSRLDDTRYAVGPLGAEILGDPGVQHMVLHHAMLYRDIADPIALLRGEPGSGALRDYWAYATRTDPLVLNETDVGPYTRLMASSQPMIASEILAVCSHFGRASRVLDIGGGDGTFLARLARCHPHLKLALFDLPAVTARARVALHGHGLDRRIDIHAGDFLRDPIPTGADLMCLIRIIHDHDDADAHRLLVAIRKALPPTGRLLLAEPMAGTRGAEAMGDAYFGFYLLAMGKGRPRTRDRLREMLRSAGFESIESVPTRLPLLVRILIAG
ncbi:MAG: methyltransferase domain-containing protein [Gammaproteobacteria bacterium]|nr:methyltransferase domain-containing protein [Gammaproteobacteria bacterium]